MTVAEVVAIKTVKPAVETITVKLTKSEALDLVRGFQGYFGHSRGVCKTLKDAAEGNTSVLTDPISAYLSARPAF